MADSRIKALSSEENVVTNGAYYYNDHYYYPISESGVTWSRAKAKCEAMDGHLATITSADEQTFIEMINNDRKWIGGYRLNGESTVWKWVTGEKWKYTNWGSGEPNNSPNVVYNECYTAVWPKQWNDLANTNTQEQGGYICEWDSAEPLKKPAKTTIISLANNKAGKLTVTWK